MFMIFQSFVCLLASLCYTLPIVFFVYVAIETAAFLVNREIFFM